MRHILYFIIGLWIVSVLIALIGIGSSVYMGGVVFLFGASLWSIYTIGKWVFNNLFY
jgi:hypothetical protein